ncbi:hypothetical protein Dimus_028025 [Dionaea muscipula]
MPKFHVSSSTSLNFSLLLTYTTWWFSAARLTTSGAGSQPKAIFILAGQSNMAGRGGVSNNTRTGLPTWDGVVPWQCRASPAVVRLSAGLKWVEAEEPLHQDIDVNRTCGVGPGMAFANELLRLDPGADVVGLVPCAVGGTSIVEWARGGYLYGLLVRRAWASVHDGGGSIRGLLWYQGESDTRTRDDAERYKARLEKFFGDLRHDLDFPLLPIIQVVIASGMGAYTERVREAQLEVGVDMENVTSVDAKGLALEADGLHLTTMAQGRLGEMLAHAFLHFFPSPAVQITSAAAPYRPPPSYNQQEELLMMPYQGPRRDFTQL